MDSMAEINAILAKHGIPFNSIEWIPLDLQKALTGPDQVTFNSIEWILASLVPFTSSSSHLSIPLNGFTPASPSPVHLRRRTFQFH